MEESSFMDGRDRWGQELARAYTVFGIDPLDRADEFGFRFPKLSVSFLREKAKEQLRDALGRWREMRGTLDDDDGSPVERANLTVQGSVEPRAFWESKGVDYGIVENLFRIEELLKEPVDPSSKERMSGLFKTMAKAIIDVPESLPGFDKDPPYDGGLRFPEDESDPIEFLEYAMDYYQDAARARLRTISFAIGGADDEVISPYRKKIDVYERGALVGYPGPLIGGSVGDRLRVYQDANKYMAAVQSRRRTLKEERSWVNRNLGKEAQSVRDLFIESGYSDKPTLVPPEEFDATPGLVIPDWERPRRGHEHGTVIFRGKNGKELTSKEIMASMQQADPEDFYLGSGIYGPGLYFGDAKIAASHGSHGGSAPEIAKMLRRGNDYITDEGSVVRAKLRPDSRVFAANSDEISDIHKTSLEWVMDMGLPEDEEEQALRELGINYVGIEDVGLFAVSHGIHAIVNYPGNITVFNRSALIMPDLGLPYSKPIRPVVTPVPMIPPGATFRERRDE